MSYLTKRKIFISTSLLLSTIPICSKKLHVLKSSPGTDYEITLAKNADVYINRDQEDLGNLVFGNVYNAGNIDILSSNSNYINIQNQSVADCESGGITIQCVGYDTNNDTEGNYLSAGNINLKSICQNNWGDGGDINIFNSAYNGFAGDIKLSSSISSSYITDVNENQADDINNGIPGNIYIGSYNYYIPTISFNGNSYHQQPASNGSGDISISSVTTHGDSGSIDIYSSSTYGKSNDLSFYTQSSYPLFDNSYYQNSTGPCVSGNINLSTNSYDYNHNQYPGSKSGNILIQSMAGKYDDDYSHPNGKGLSSGNIEFSTISNSDNPSSLSGDVNIISRAYQGATGNLNIYSYSNNNDTGDIYLYSQADNNGSTGDMYLGLFGNYNSGGIDIETASANGNSGDIYLQTLASDVDNKKYSNTQSGNILIQSMAGTFDGDYTSPNGNGLSSGNIEFSTVSNSNDSSTNSGNATIQSLAYGGVSGNISIKTRSINNNSGNIEIISSSDHGPYTGDITIKTSLDESGYKAGDLFFGSTVYEGNSGTINIVTATNYGNSGGLNFASDTYHGYAKSISSSTTAFNPNISDWYGEYSTYRHGSLLNITGSGSITQGGYDYYEDPMYGNIGNAVTVTDGSFLVLPSRTTVNYENGLLQPTNIPTHTWVRFPDMSYNFDKIDLITPCESIMIKDAGSKFWYDAGAGQSAIFYQTNMSSYRIENVPAGASLTFQNNPWMEDGVWAKFIPKDSTLNTVEIQWDGANNRNDYTVDYAYLNALTSANPTTLNTFVRYTIPSMGTEFSGNNVTYWGDSIIIQNNGYYVRLVHKGDTIAYYNHAFDQDYLLTAEYDNQQFPLSQYDEISTITDTEIIFTCLNNVEYNITTPPISISWNSESLYNFLLNGDSINNSIILAAKSISPIYSTDNSVIIAGDQISFDTSDLRLYNLSYPTAGETVYGLSINRNGQVFMSTGATSTFSSLRFKENIQSLEDFNTEEVFDLNTYSFNYKNNPSITEYGLIVEELVENGTMECAVRYDREGNPEAISYNTIMIAMLKEMQKLKNRYDNDMDRMKVHIYNLEDTIFSLQDNVQYLQNIINEMQ